MGSGHTGPDLGRTGPDLGGMRPDLGTQALIWVVQGLICSIRLDPGSAWLDLGSTKTWSGRNEAGTKCMKPDCVHGA